jgi:Mn2+/Fe2+ NRAMP family transporter
MAGQQDITEAKGTYSGFLTLFKWGAVATAVVTALVVLIIAN